VATAAEVADRNEGISVNPGEENAAMAKTVLTGVVVALALALAIPAAAQDDLKVSIGGKVVSDYVWRGQVINDDGALQPWAKVGISGFGLKVWGSMDLDDDPNDAQWEFTEVRVKGSYTIPISAYSLDVGGIYYNYPNTDIESTFEAFGKFTFSEVIFSPYVALYYDLDQIEGFYLRVGGSYGQELETFNWKVDVWIAAGSSDYNEGYFWVDDFALNDLTARFKVTFPFTEQFSVSAFVSGSWLMDSDIQDAVVDDSKLAFGAGVKYSF
jgi:uncharacterized protein (TIGR02001 family)